MKRYDRQRTLRLTIATSLAMLPTTIAFLSRNDVAHPITCPSIRLPSGRSRNEFLHMISNIFGSKDAGALPQLPRDVKEAVSACRAATQNALSNRISRMDIEFPVGTRFGIEKVPKTVRKNAETSTPTALDFQRSDRELARLFVDMFQPVGGDNIVVAFTDVETADAARRQWKDDSTAAARILSLDRRKSSNVAAKQKRKVASKGFAAKLAMEIDELSLDDTELSAIGPFALPPNTEVALFVAPGPKELVTIERICAQVGMGTLVILLNARLSQVSSFDSTSTFTTQEHLLDSFEPIFQLTAAPQDAAPGCMLHRVYGHDWMLARKPAVGPPKTILVQPTRPNPTECAAALDSLALSSVERNVETAMENIAGWFR